MTKWPEYQAWLALCSGTCHHCAFVLAWVSCVMVVFLACSSAASEVDGPHAVEPTSATTAGSRGPALVAKEPLSVAPTAVQELEYPLDKVSRKVPMSGRIECPPVELVDYQGTLIPLQKKARLYADFVPHLARFEELVSETAKEIYGRAPSRIRHAGAYYCRRIRTWGYLTSEHGLGNALDVEGFEFDRVKKGEGEGVAQVWRAAFTVTLSKHWVAQGVHRDFLRLLAKRVIAEPDLFRVILGPADPKHTSHFHLDMAPFRIVNVF